MSHESRMMALIDNQATARAFIKFIIDMNINTEKTSLTLVHVLKESTGEKALMGEKVTKEKIDRARSFLEEVRSKLPACGFMEEQIEIDLLRKKNSTVTKCVIEKIKREDYSTVFLGRKYNLSKSEEFVLGDVSSRLLRAPLKTNIVVLKLTDVE